VSRRTVGALVAGLAVLALSGLAALAGADSFTPVVLGIKIAATGRVGQKLPITVTVTADPSVLDTRTAPLRIEVKLAEECGGTYQYTPGAVLLNQQLAPQPAAGKAYDAVAHGSGTPRETGAQTVCAWLVEEGDQRVFASSQSDSVNVLNAKKAARKHAKKRGRKHPKRARKRTARAASAGMPPIRHVFIIVLENESASVTFGANTPAPYLARTLTSEGAYLPHYYGIGHASNDNYIAMISGQAPNVDNQADCQVFGNFPAAITGAYGQQEGAGCVYPSNIKTIGSELDSAGDTWRDYNQSMGDVPSRESAECGHPAVGTQDHTQTEAAGDPYATRHDPFVYFHSIIDDQAYCDEHVVNLNDLTTDLRSASTTPNYVFITPDLCGDGHDPVCTGEPSREGGFGGIEQFLEQWVPAITRSPAFTTQNGLLIITFDESAESDTSSCCGEIPGPGSPLPGLSGKGGGDVGAVLLSPCIKPGTVSETPYNHYSMLRSVEDIFGVPHLGYSQLPGETDFGSDVFTRSCTSSGTSSTSKHPGHKTKKKPKKPKKRKKRRRK
jgi:phosphatidylinositol-3-phosphatase